MKISIVTVVYNNEKTIVDAIESVLSQRYENIEYIIIDGNSTDRTLDIIKKYGKRINKVVSEPDKGIYDAMNKGINLATGEIIGLLNSDDLYADNGVIKNVVEQFEKNKGLDIVYGNLVYVKAENTNNIVRNWKASDYHPRYFENGNVPPHPTVFLKSKVYKEAGLFKTHYKLAADYEFLLRIFKNHSFQSRYVDQLMVRMRMGGATNKSWKNILNGNREIIAAWRDNNLPVPKLLMFHRIIKRLIQFI
jgi:glycosyltransferase involved in cell wall biosynthesis